MDPLGFDSDRRNEELDFFYTLGWIRQKLGRDRQAAKVYNDLTLVGMNEFMLTLGYRHAWRGEPLDI